MTLALIEPFVDWSVFTTTKETARFKQEKVPAGRERSIPQVHLSKLKQFSTQTVCWYLRFWVITQRVVVIHYRRFGSTFRSHLQGATSLRRLYAVKTGEMLSPSILMAEVWFRCAWGIGSNLTQSIFFFVAVALYQSPPPFSLSPSAEKNATPFSWEMKQFSGLIKIWKYGTKKICYYNFT